jgi:hypothetical protein
MKQLLLTTIAALFLATGTAHAVEWQCGPHYVSTFALHTERVDDTYKHIIASPVYNRTREDVMKNNLGGDDEFGLPYKGKSYKGFRWSLEPKDRRHRLLTYRGKPCFPYPIEAQQ